MVLINGGYKGHKGFETTPIGRLEQYQKEIERDIHLGKNYHDREKFNPEKAALLCGGINQVMTRNDALQLSRLKEWRGEIASRSMH